MQQVRAGRRGRVQHIRAGVPVSRLPAKHVIGCKKMRFGLHRTCRTYDRIGVQHHLPIGLQATARHKVEFGGDTVDQRQATGHRAAYPYHSSRRGFSARRLYENAAP